MDTVFLHQDCSPRHVIADVVQVLNETLPDRWLDGCFLIAWLPTSLDLTFSGSFLCGVNQIEQHGCRKCANGKHFGSLLQTDYEERR